MGLLMELVPEEILRDRVKSTEEFLLTKRGHFLLGDQRKRAKKRTQSVVLGFGSLGIAFRCR